MIDDTSDPFRSISHSINCSTVYISFCVPYIHDVTEEKIYNIIQHVVYQVLYTTRYLVLLNKYGFSHRSQLLSSSNSSTTGDWW